MDKFSNTLTPFTGIIENDALSDSLHSLAVMTESELKMLDWGNDRLAIPIEVNVELPSLGNYKEINIRGVEPVVFVFHIKEYPFSAPIVFTDRLDFPKDRLSHLYIAVNGRPPAFCYVRGSTDEWYANKRIEDLVVRISNWLRDAATGNLTENGEQFDPLRLEGYSGIIIYDYDAFVKVITDDNSKKPAFALFERSKIKGQSVFKFVKHITFENISETITMVMEEKNKSADDTTRIDYHYAYILWNFEEEVSDEYCVNLPRNWESFKEFSRLYKIDFNVLEKVIAQCNSINTFVHFPVIIGIKRPKTLIGYSSNIEFVNFRFWLKNEDIKEEKIVNNISIDILSHNQPLSRKQAGQLSNYDIDTKVRPVIFGCGALGSKVIMHLARAGQTSLTLIDPDHISPHNLVRHALFAEDEGENKATVLATRIKTMYPHQTTGICSLPQLSTIDNEDFFALHKWIIDFTASEAFFNELTSSNSISGQNVVSASISDFGDLGVLYKEGEGRNPRIDDLQVYLYSLSVHNRKIHNWLKREMQTVNSYNTMVRVGVGCNSETTILSDDKISTHSSYFSVILKREMMNPSKNGKIYLIHIEDNKDYKIKTNSIIVKPFDVFNASNDSTWMIRIKNGVLRKMKNETVESGKNETGGVLIGVCNYKTKTIHVVESITPPSDSIASPFYFIRGHKGLPEEIKCFEKCSGQQLGYIGEWHSHPNGPNTLSVQDMRSVCKHKKEFSQLNPPLPVFLSIITPDGFYPFVY